MQVQKRSKHLKLLLQLEHPIAWHAVLLLPPVLNPGQVLMAGAL
jgi:hypothetical protein